ncbi:MAG: heavy metal translocating P-type ATPase [Anaerovoracaceae bacterium]|jgi:heavy metal translocating P-type ATPase
MRCKILHESEGRMRVHVFSEKMTLDQADILEYYLRDVDGVIDVKVSDRTANATVCYVVGMRDDLIRAFAAFSYDDPRAKSLVPENTGRALSRHFQDKLTMALVRRVFWNLLAPMHLKRVVTVFKAIPYIKRGLDSLRAGRLDVDVLDATAIGVSLLRNEMKTASSLMFLLQVGGILEEWTQKKSIDDLARAMSLNISNVWKKENGTEALVPIQSVAVGDKIVVRAGSQIPLDGKVIGGEAMVNQASITGEPLAVAKEEGSYVYAGTVVEEGECIFTVDKVSGTGRYDKIVKMIEESEKLKSDTEDRASKLADKLVPYTLGGTVLIYLVTRNITKALAVLMVDFSCALKLAMPIAVLSAMRESSYYQISVKGGKFMEGVAQADVIVFDKTGTLTHAEPKVKQVVSFGGRDEMEMLRLAACLEEHYPHSMAKAVVAAAEEKELHHEEHHSKVEYVVAHGISSWVEGEKVIIGSHHFVFQDEKCSVDEDGERALENLPQHLSHLYMAINGKLAAVLSIEDPIREEAAAVITSLHNLNIKKVIMLTGDSKGTAKTVAEKLGIDEYRAEMLPEEKALYVEEERKKGNTVIMVGDGINDSPALSAADVGIAISDGAPIAREIADITISADNLFALTNLKSISDGLMRRIQKNYRFIISFNFGLILLGIGGVITPVTSSLLHNMSTLAVGVHSTTNLLE